VSLGVIGLHPREPVIDLADPEAQLATDAEPARTAALAAQVVQGLDTDAELDGQLREGEDGAQCRRGDQRVWWS
jgi:hypothetical protein